MTTAVKGILTDITRCIGCQECVAACTRTYGLGRNIPRRWDKMDGLSARRWTSIVERRGRFVRKQCRHCLEPGCVSVCPVGALQKTPEGPVIYSGSRCMGCRYCMMACPFGIPRYDWDKPTPFVRKCILCYERLQEGKPPACTEACPTGATIFGPREELLAEARQRLEQARRDPDRHPRYIPKVFGETEAGGTCVLYLSDIDLKFLSYNKDPGPDPLPHTTSAVVQSVPLVFLGVGALMYGLHWIMERRTKLQQESPPAEGTSHE